MDVRAKVGFGRGWVSAANNTACLPGQGASANGGEIPTYSDEGGASFSLGQGAAPSPHTSTPIQRQPNETESALGHLGVLITELGKHIGDSVTARLLSDRESRHYCQGRDGGSAQSNSTSVDLTQFDMVLKSNCREPPVFRGDSTDKCSIHEWIDLMVLYLKKKNIGTADRPDEIMSRLMGWAKDVVRIGIRSDPSLSAEQQPETIFAILKHHFSDLSYSSMPLADFYSTLPKPHEGPVDY